MKEEQLFIDYCQKHPIDMAILNQLSDYVLHDIARNITIYHSNRAPYVFYPNDGHLYIFEIKDNETYNSLVILNNRITDITFNYNDEQDYILNGHRLKCIFTDNNEVASLVDEETKYNLVSIYKNNVSVSKDILGIIPNCNIQFADKRWKTVADFPDELKTIINTIRVLMSLKTV
jgi:hypothetical protein